MTHKILLGIIGCVLCSPAFAKPTIDTVDLTGVWVFETQQFHERPCIMSGEIRVRPTASEKWFEADLVTREQCDNVDLTITAEQTSTIQVVNLAVKIHSEVKTVSPPIPYRPDHFRLRIVNEDHLVGLLDSNVHAPVVFKRQNADAEAGLE